MKCKNKKHKKANIRNKDSKIKRRIFIGIEKKNKKISKIKKRVSKKNKSYIELEEFNNIPNIKDKNKEEIEMKDIYDCDFNCIINIETNIRTNNSF